MRTIIKAFVVIFMTMSSIYANSKDEYLLFEQKNGLWSYGTKQETRDTVQVLRCLGMMDHPLSATSVSVGKQFLVKSLLEKDESTAGLVYLTAFDDIDHSNQLLNFMNEDGGWGVTKGKRSDLLHTIMAAEVLLKRGVAPQTGWNKTAELIFEGQDVEGLWNLSIEDSIGQLVLSAQVLRVLNLLSEVEGLQGVLEVCQRKSIDALKNTLQADGRFSLNSDLTVPFSVVDTAEVYRTLILFEPVALYAKTLDLLTDSQNSDGSWSEYGKAEMDIFTTATALSAIWSTPKLLLSSTADLAVLNSSIAFSMVNIKGVDFIKVNVVVFNLGDRIANNVEVEFNLGDPRAGGVINDTFSIPSINAKGSKSIDAIFSPKEVTQELEYRPVIHIRVDPLNKIPESNLINNLAFKKLDVSGIPDELPDAPVLAGPDLFLDVNHITLNQENVNELYLAANPTVEVSVLISNIGSVSAQGFNLKVMQGQDVIATKRIEGIAEYSQISHEFLWAPQAGPNTLKIVLDSDNEVSELLESNNEVTKEINVIGATNAVVVKKILDGNLLEPPVEAYDRVLIKVITSSANTFSEISVQKNGEDSVTTSSPFSLDLVGQYQWNIVNNTPGSYTITARIKDEESKAVVESVSESIVVLATEKIRSQRLFLARDIIEGGDILPVNISLFINNGSNVDTTWYYSWNVIDPDGILVLSSSGNQELVLPAAQKTKTFNFAESLQGKFDKPGRYQLQVQALTLSGAKATAEASFSLLPGLKLNVTNEVLPKKMAAFDKARVRTIIHLAASDRSAEIDIPVSVDKILMSSSDALVDDVSVNASIVLSGIRNALGGFVSDGTKIAVYVPYGNLLNGVDSPTPYRAEEGAFSNPQIKLYEVLDGKVTVEYQPRGDALSANKKSLTVMQVHQYFEKEEKWLGEKIEKQNIFLIGQ